MCRVRPALWCVLQGIYNRFHYQVQLSFLSLWFTRYCRYKLFLATLSSTHSLHFLRWKILLFPLFLTLFWSSSKTVYDLNILALQLKSLSLVLDGTPLALWIYFFSNRLKQSTSVDFICQTVSQFLWLSHMSSHRPPFLAAVKSH